MNHQAILTDRAKYETDEEFLAVANSITYAPRPYFASVRTVYNLFGGAVAAALTQALESLDAVAAAMFKIPGDEKGTGGGIDLSLPQAQNMINYFAGIGLLTAEQAATLKDLGRTVLYDAQRRYGVDAVTQEVLDAARQRAATDNLRQGIADVYNVIVAAIDSGESYTDVRSAYLAHLPE